MSNKKSRSEDAIQKLEEKHRIFLDNLPDPVFALNQEGRYIYINRAFTKGVGKTINQIIGKTIWDVFEREDADRCFVALNKVFQSGEENVIEVRVPRLNGDLYFITTITPIINDYGKVINVICSSKDITEEAKYRLLVDHSYDLLWNITTEGVFTYVSPSWERITGYIPSLLTGTSYKDIVNSEDIPVCEEYLQNIISSNKEVNTVEYRIRHADGTWHWYNAGGMPVLNQNGEVVSIVGISRDITEQKKAEDKLLLNEEKYRILVSEINQGLAFHEVICNELGEVIDYRLTYANENFKNITGLKSDDILGKTIREICPDIDNNWLEKYGQVGITGEPLEFERYFNRLGAYYHVLNYSHQYGRFATIITDVTERKMMEKTIFEEKELLRITLLSVGDGIITTDKQGKVNLLNKVAERLTGWKLEEAYGRLFEEVFIVINEYTRERYNDIQTEVLKCGRTIESANDTVLICKNGLEMPIENTASPIKDEEGKINGMVLVFRDFTEKKKKQEKIEYLSFHDSLTGLYNRRFFKEELKRLDSKRNLPITLVMADVNGLKLANDAFGHMVGDKLLQKAAEVIKNECRVDDIIARIGGDEFVLLLPRTSSEQASIIVKRINDTLAKQRVISSDMLSSFVLSISFGWDSKLDETEDIAGVFKKAEDFMYRRKLSESTSMRHETIKVIIKTLYEKSEREQFHSVQVSEICGAIGVAMELSVEQISELRTAGLMHDIGKIVLNDQILDKQGALTDSEWFEIKRHAETGYRILESVKEFSQLAEYVLAHHERWDGKGYPKGLIAEEIPLEARIIAIADSYNAMISDRSYRKAMSKEAAIEELIKNSGTQFDPVITSLFVEKVLKVRKS